MQFKAQCFEKEWEATVLGQTPDGAFFVGYITYTHGEKDQVFPCIWYSKSGVSLHNTVTKHHDIELSTRVECN